MNCNYITNDMNYFIIDKEKVFDDGRKEIKIDGYTE